MSDSKITPPISSFATMGNVKEYFLKEPFNISKDPLYDFVQTNSGIFPKNNFGGSDGGGGSYDTDIQKLKTDVIEIQNTLNSMRNAAVSATTMLSNIEEIPSAYQEVDQIISSVVVTKNSLSSYFDEII